MLWGRKRLTHTCWAEEALGSQEDISRVLTRCQTALQDRAALRRSWVTDGQDHTVTRIAELAYSLLSISA